jgi:hypothetical protein
VSLIQLNADLGKVFDVFCDSLINSCLLTQDIKSVYHGIDRNRGLNWSRALFRLNELLLHTDPDLVRAARGSKLSLQCIDDLVKPSDFSVFLLVGVAKLLYEKAKLFELHVINLRIKFNDFFHRMICSHFYTEIHCGTKLI